MPNPLRMLTEALAEAATHADVLPASGQATAEEARPDEDQAEETALAGNEKVYDTIWERPERGGTPPLYVKCLPLSREEDHLFRYFVDGSFRSYFLGTLVAQQWESPMIFGQAGACALRRRDDGSVEQERVQVKQVIALARFSDALWEALEARTAGTEIILADILEGDQLAPAAGRTDPRDKAIGKVGWQAHLLETQIIRASLPKLGPDCWLVADGSLRFAPLHEILSQTGQVAPVIGVAKNFRRDVYFRVGRGPRGETLTLYRLLANLEYQHRTAAFGSPDARFVFWYVRLREQGKLEYPLMGVVKAELVNPTGEAISSELIDRLSRALVAERNVTPHGRDRRWHAHLYPIYLAEIVVKSAFFSEEVVRAALLWR